MDANERGVSRWVRRRTWIPSRGTICRRFDQWPDLLLDRPEFQYPEYLNAAVELTDRMVEKGFGDHVALIGNGRQRTYKELADWTNRLAHAWSRTSASSPATAC